MDPKPRSLAAPARAAAALLLAGTAALAAAQTTIVSTQLRPIEEAEKMRNVILKGAPDAVNFVPEDPNTYLTRMKAELGAAQGKVHATIGLDGELGPVNALGGSCRISTTWPPSSARTANSRLPRYRWASWAATSCASCH